MSGSTAIEWTNSTWNPTTGRTKVSPGCAHCYIEQQPPFRIEGRKFNRGTIPIRFHEDRLDQPRHWRRPRMVFVNSMSDLFHEDIPFMFIDRVWDTMEAASQHVFQVLTKRPERMREYAETRTELPNVWLGVTIENARHTWRADFLRGTRAAVSFISAEPLLGSVYSEERSLDLDGIDWIIVGGESGKGCRPMDLDWAREVRDDCLARKDGPAMFLKQLGGHPDKRGGNKAVLDGQRWTEYPSSVVAVA